jgi:hypothetical protein
MRELIIAGVALLVACAPQRADEDFKPVISTPAFRNSTASPRVCIDAGHNNSHTADGLYRPFATLLRSDGYRVSGIRAKFEDGVPSECAIVVIVNAAGGKTYKLFGFNLPTKSRERRPLSAFTPREISKVKEWVTGGGSLLLIADHYPFGSSAHDLSDALGVDMRGGFTEADNVGPAHERDRSRLVFSKTSGTLGHHPITDSVGTVVTFTGQSLSSPRGVSLLMLGNHAVDYVGTPPRMESVDASGRSQGVALEIGKGRVVVLGEAAELTAQIDDSGIRFGMQTEDNDNQRFALRIAHWLSRLI